MPSNTTSSPHAALIPLSTLLSVLLVLLDPVLGTLFTLRLVRLPRMLSDILSQETIQTKSTQFALLRTLSSGSRAQLAQRKRSRRQYEKGVL